jgi:hypothetical protein
MNPGRKRWLLRLAVVILAGLAALLWFSGPRPRDLAVENRSGQSIASLQITVAGQTNAFRDVADGASVTAAYQARDDDSFRMDGRLADGTRIRASGMLGERTQFLVLPGGQIVPKKAGPNAP